MVKLTMAVLLALMATASAESDDSGGDESPAFNMFGFDVSVGGLPVNGEDTTVVALGLSVEHPVFTRTRVLGEYSWLWLEERDPTADEHGSGHRASLGLRREWIGKGGGSTRGFLDGELGASVALINDTMTGVSMLPGVFAGLRVGYDLYSRRDASPSRTFESAFLLRATALQDGFGLSVGLGMFWGN